MSATKILASSRKDYVAALKQCTNNVLAEVLTDTSSSSSSEQRYLDERSESAIALCDIIELILIHGMNIHATSNDANSPTMSTNVKIPLWELLEHFEGVQYNYCIPLRNAVAAVASIPSLRTSWGKSRAFVRQLLNSMAIVSIFEYFTSPHVTKSKLVHFMYYPEAIVRYREDAEMVLDILRILKIVAFNFNLDRCDK